MTQNTSFFFIPKHVLLLQAQNAKILSGYRSLSESGSRRTEQLECAGAPALLTMDNQLTVYVHITFRSLRWKNKPKHCFDWFVVIKNTISTEKTSRKVWIIRQVNIVVYGMVCPGQWSYFNSINIWFADQFKWKILIMVHVLSFDTILTMSG